jgi:hypothetical protein
MGWAIDGALRIHVCRRFYSLQGSTIFLDEEMPALPLFFFLNDYSIQRLSR